MRPSQDATSGAGMKTRAEEAPGQGVNVQGDTVGSG